MMAPRFVWLISWQGMLLSGVTLVAFFLGMCWYGAEGPGLRHATTLAFMTLALAQVFHAFNARSQVRSAFTAQLFTNGWLWAAVAACLLLQLAAVYVPFLQTVLRTDSLTVADWGVVLACSLIPVVWSSWSNSSDARPARCQEGKLMAPAPVDPEKTGAVPPVNFRLDVPDLRAKTSPNDSLADIRERWRFLAHNFTFPSRKTLTI
jgi:Ca2+-transporting ATPase